MSSLKILRDGVRESRLRRQLPQPARVRRKVTSRRSYAVVSISYPTDNLTHKRLSNRTGKRTKSMAVTECSMDEWITDIGKKFDKVFCISENVEAAAELVFTSLFEEAILEEVFDAHRSEREISVAEQSIADEEIKEFEIHESIEGCVFGGQFDSDTSMTLCPRCPRRYTTGKFTTHFENCVGKGRSSSLVAKFKIANNFIKNAYGEISDDEWKASSDKPKRRKIMDKKKGQDKGSIKRGKPKNKKK